MDGLKSLEEWQGLWQADTQLPPGLLGKANQQLRRARIMLMADVGVTIVIGGGFALWAFVTGTPSVRLLAIWVWSMIAVAWLFRWFNHPSNLSGAAVNTEVFLEKLRKSYRATLNVLIFGWILGIAQLLFVSAWVFRELNARRPVTIQQFVTEPANLCVWFCIAAGFTWTVRLFLKIRLELKMVERLKDEWICTDLDGPSTAAKPGLISFLLDRISKFPLLVDDFAWRVRRKKKSWKF